MSSVPLPDAICNKCNKQASLMCQRCHETYCTTDCQILDWKEHKSKCHQMPNLVPIRSRLQRSANTTANESFVADGMPMRRPHQTSNEIRRNFDPTRRLQREAGTGDGKHRSLAHNPLPNNESSLLFEDKDFTLKPKLSADASGTTNIVDNCKGAIPKIGSKVADINSMEKLPPAPWTIPFSPPEGIYFDAIIQFLEDADPSVIWVTQMKYESALAKLQLDINRNLCKAVTEAPLEEIRAGALVAAPFEGAYYRAEVLKVGANTQQVMLRLIDYGNQLEAVPLAQVRAPIPIMRNLNAYAMRVRMPKNKSHKGLQVESLVTIRVLPSTDTLLNNDIFYVEFKPKSVPLHLALMLNSPTEIALLKVFTGARHALVQLVAWQESIDSDMSILLNSEHGIRLDFDAVPPEGAFVAARTSQGWRRACLLGYWDVDNVYLVYLIDEGRIGVSPQVKKIPSDFLEMPMRVFAIVVSIPNELLDSTKLAAASKLSLRMQAISTTAASKAEGGVKSLPCALYANEDKITEVIATVFGGMLDNLGISCWTEHISDGSLVYITHVLTHSEFFISSVSTVNYTKMFTSLASKCALYGENKKVIKDDIVLAVMEERGIYFRAKIISTMSCASNSLIYKVLDIDTGLNCNVPHSNLRKPNLFIRSCPIYAKKVKLIYVEKIPTPIVDNKALVTLEECQKNGVEFIVQHCVSEPEIVDLLLKTDEQQSLSKQLLPLLFEKRTDNICATPKSVASDCSSSVVTAPIGSTLAEDTALPPSPPDTPVVKIAPVKFDSASASQGAALIPLPNLNVQQMAAATAAKTYTLADLPIIPIPNGDRVSLMVLDPTTISDGYITACDFSNKDLLMQFENKLKLVEKHCSCSHLERNYEPKVGELCLAIYAEDGQWYRASCLSATKDGAFIVIFLDYGNNAKVTRKEIMPMPKDLMFASNANMCYVDGLPEKLTTEQLKAFVIAALSNPILECKVQSQEDFYIIKIQDMDKYFA